MQAIQRTGVPAPALFYIKQRLGLHAVDLVCLVAPCVFEAALHMQAQRSEQVDQLPRAGHLWHMCDRGGGGRRGTQCPHRHRAAETQLSTAWPVRFATTPLCLLLRNAITLQRNPTHTATLMHVPLRCGRPPNPALRLACQCTVAGDLLVRKRAGFWGSNASALAPASEGTTYFGEIEYVLDSKSPPPEPCPVCDGSELVPCPLCEGTGLRDLGQPEASQCSACGGSGQVVCRSCFSGDPFDLAAVRQRAKQRPD